MKVANHNEFINLLKKSGFKLVRRGTHEKWSNGEEFAFIPNKHKYFNRHKAEMVLKKLNIT